MKFLVLIFVAISLSLVPSVSQSTRGGRSRILDSFLPGKPKLLLTDEDEIRYASAYYHLLQFRAQTDLLDSNEVWIFSQFLNELKKTEEVCKSVLNVGPGFLNWRRKKCFKLLRKNNARRIESIEPASKMSSQNYPGFEAKMKN